MVAGQTLVANNEPHSVPASSPYTVTATNSATFGIDLGVRYAATGIPLTNVASSPTIGNIRIQQACTHLSLLQHADHLLHAEPLPPHPKSILFPWLDLVED
jgi:hypothetical protein